MRAAAGPTGPRGVTRLVLVAAFVCVAALLAAATSRAAAPRRVLFIGNSLTAANDLPRMVEALTAGELASTSLSKSNFSLEDHWRAADARRTIAAGGWSLVVLQQGPSALPESQRLLRDYVRRFDTEIRRAGAATALYMVWPAKARADDFDGVHASYAHAAADVGAPLLAAGDAWRAAWRRDPSLPLYGTDGFHPSEMGSYLAALVIASALTGRTPHRLSGIAASSGWLPSSTPERLRLLQDAAADVTVLSKNP